MPLRTIYKNHINFRNIILSKFVYFVYCLFQTFQRFYVQKMKRNEKNWEGKSEYKGGIESRSYWMQLLNWSKDQRKGFYIYIRAIYSNIRKPYLVLLKAQSYNFWMIWLFPQQLISVKLPFYLMNKIMLKIFNFS